MKTSFAALERQRLARCRLLAELLYRRLPRPGGWSHRGVQLGTESRMVKILERAETMGDLLTRLTVA